MGLTSSSTGVKLANTELYIKKHNEKDKIIAIAGNPNVGKSTLFNALTGMKQHTGNWPGKTVANAQGYCETKSNSYILVDIPGTYSLMSASPEEEIARNFICFGGSDAVVIVCDATCLERNLNLVLQTLEITDNVIVCVNLLDEAKRKGIKIDLDLLSEKLGVPVVGTIAKNKKSLSSLLLALDKNEEKEKRQTYSVRYPDIIETAIKKIQNAINKRNIGNLSSRWLAIKIIENDKSVIKEIQKNLSEDFFKDNEILSAIKTTREYLQLEGIRDERQKDMISSSTVVAAEKLCKDIVNFTNKGYSKFDRKLDRLFTSRKSGYLIMILLLIFIFWLTISGANYISDYLSSVLWKTEDLLSRFLVFVNCPKYLHKILVEGVFRVPAWVVSVMLPPMAIFFPLFTILEDSGYLPRIAYSLDKPFKHCGSCGKQALTMCMGFGCNAAGVVGGRIINSERERLLAIITNSIVPCNGRFPTIIAIISMFFITLKGIGASIVSSLLLTTVILSGILITFISTKLLSKTFLKGTASSYTLEMPPYRKPKLLSVIVHSVFDRTLFVLARSVSVAIPAGIIIWVFANITVNGSTLLMLCADFLDPFARLLGLDGVILIAFILGFPANEIVIPIVIMAYLSNGSLTELSSINEIKEILITNGWTGLTAICTIIFSLLHWPCSTTVLTIKKETGSIKWTAIAVLLPTIIGMLLCMIITFIFNLLN